jgi:nitrite reductase/ring-hydroxylating ferredoxin subunit
MPRYYLCRSSDIIGNRCKEFQLEDMEPPLALFLVQHDDQIYAYENRCPHTGINLNWQPGQFLDITNQLLQCSTHGALFRIHDGYCIRGPCAGSSLVPLALAFENDEIYLER